MKLSTHLFVFAFVSSSIIGPLALADTATATATATDVVDLDSKLEELKLPTNAAPASLTSEKLYTVQNRYSDLRLKSEVTLGGGRNFTGNTFVQSTQLDLTYRFHLNNRWYLSASGSYAFNSLSEGAKTLFDTRNILPDAAFVKNRADFLVGLHLFYGKLRFTMDRVAYFDQYVAVGPGLVWTQFGRAPSAVLDVGLAFWPGKRMSFRFGVKNEFFKEQRLLSSSTVYHMLGHVDVGVTFGGSGGAKL